MTWMLVDITDIPTKQSNLQGKFVLLVHLFGTLA